MKNFSSEIIYKTARSSGAGGQNLNKVETMVTAKWHIDNSMFFNEEEKEILLMKLKNRINSEGFLQIGSQESRYQLDNKEIATEKILQLVEKALIIPKKRTKTKPTKASRERRLNEKKQQAEKKGNRNFRI